MQYYNSTSIIVRECSLIVACINMHDISTSSMQHVCCMLGRRLPAAANGGRSRRCDAATYVYVCIYIYIYVYLSIYIYIYVYIYV